MTLGIGILTWRKPETLEHTLESYARNGLFDIANESLLFIQEANWDEIQVAKRFGLPYIKTDNNIGIGPAFKQLAETIQTDFFVPLENDWELVEPREVAESELKKGINAIAQSDVNAYRLRHRHQYGEPLYSQWLKDQELTGNATAHYHLLDCVHWREQPDIDFPKMIRREKEMYVCDSQFANHTNNPVLYDRAWFLNVVCPQFVGGERSNEEEVYHWWARQHFKVGQDHGLFCHRDLTCETPLSRTETNKRPKNANSVIRKCVKWIKQFSRFESRPKSKVISFSLWGDNPKYTIGAIRNAEIAQQLFPGWICYFYVGTSTPSEIVKELDSFDNTKVIQLDQPGDWRTMFCRFYPCSDPDVAIVLSRDADSRLSERERAAVDQWLASPFDFHIMRDHPAHDAPILGGMWGCRNRLLCKITKMINRYQKGDYWQVDQNFLREVVYPKVRQKALVHDEFFEAKPFPLPRRGLEFVGEVYDENDRPHSEHRRQLEEHLNNSADVDSIRETAA